MTAKRTCSSCTRPKTESAFDRSPSTGRLYRICRNCKSSNKNERSEEEQWAQMNPQQKLDSRWIAHYLSWYEAGHREAVAPTDSHGCAAPILISRLTTDYADTHNEIVLYCNGCLTMWRTGKHSQANESMATYRAAADAIYQRERVSGD